MSDDIVPKINASCVANIEDIPTNAQLLYSPSSSPSTEPNSISLAPLLLKLVIGLCYLFFS